MIERSVDHSPQTLETADTGATIEIEPISGGVIVRVFYPEDRRRRNVKSLKIVCAILCLLPAIAWLIFRRKSGDWFAVIAAAVVAGYVIVTMVRTFLAISRSYVFRADATGLAIETLRGARKDEQHLPRSQINDIVLGFGYYRGPHSLFRSWMVIATNAMFSSDIECLQNLGGDHLARVADALRAALGMPKRSWP